MLRVAPQEAVVGGRLVVKPHCQRPRAQARRERVLKDFTVGLVRNKREPVGEGPLHGFVSRREEAAGATGRVRDKGPPARRAVLRVVEANELSVVGDQCLELG